tara:strand:- start:514 stop:948 length:435 start_codon:yes stop_codon:yes gene_type:complete
MRESSLARTLREKLGPLGQWTRIENVVGTGMPDVNWFPGTDIWIELKVVHGTKVFFQASQISWAKHRHKKRGSVWIIAKGEKEIIISNSINLYDKVRYEHHKPVLHISVMKEYGVTFVKPYNWKSIIGLLCDDIQFCDFAGTTM